MDLFLHVYSLLIFLYWLIKGSDLLAGFLFLIPELEKIPLSRKKVCPKVSVIFAARNEEKRLESSLRSLLSQDYPDFEVIAVNDRSTDKTSEILKRHQKDKRLKVVDVKKLPSKWLGKSHALYKGYQLSKGEWLIFTDADVWYAPDTVKRAVNATQEKELDHLALFPHVQIKKLIESIFIHYFLIVFCMRYRPWAAQFSFMRAYTGVGAFNCVRRSAYEKAGTHKRLALSIDDDLALGRMLKRNGFRQMAMQAGKSISLQWVHGWKGVLNALHKNAFTGLSYNVFLLIAVSFTMISVDIVPFVLALTASGPVLILALASLLMIFLIYALWQRFYRHSLPLFFLHFAGSCLVLVIMWRSCLEALLKGGINWRGTFYSLKELRQFQKVSHRGQNPA